MKTAAFDEFEAAVLLLKGYCERESVEREEEPPPLSG
jgi:hypothetical protein